MADRIVTGNRLGDGAVVFLAPNGCWTEDIRQAHVVSTDGEARALEELGGAAEKAQMVVGPYLIEVVSETDEVKPVLYKERIRAYGPSIHPEYAKQDVPEHFEQADGVPPFAAAGLAG